MVQIVENKEQPESEQIQRIDSKVDELRNRTDFIVETYNPLRYLGPMVRDELSMALEPFFSPNTR